MYSNMQKKNLSAGRNCASYAQLGGEEMHAKSAYRSVEFALLGLCMLMK